MCTSAPLPFHGNRDEAQHSSALDTVRPASSLACMHRCCMLTTSSHVADIVHSSADIVPGNKPRNRRPCDLCGIVRRGPSARRCCVCNACRSAYYCSNECQHAAWLDGHWIMCGPATKLRSLAIEMKTGHSIVRDKVTVSLAQYRTGWHDH